MNGHFMLQAIDPGWVGPTMAVSLVIIALAFFSIAVALLIAGRQLGKAGGDLTREIHELRQELEPVIGSMGRLTVKGEALTEQLGGELREILETSRRTRFSFERGVKQAQRRLQDFDALIEVVQEEVEETALDASAALRNARHAGGAIGLVRRLLVRGRR